MSSLASFPPEKVANHAFVSLRILDNAKHDWQEWYKAYKENVKTTWEANSLAYRMFHDRWWFEVRMRAMVAQELDQHDKFMKSYEFKRKRLADLAVLANETTDSVMYITPDDGALLRLDRPE